jgi:hypothetical protein
MNARELITHLRSKGGTIEPAEYFLYLAAHAHEARLNDGSRLLDQTDFTTFLIEVAKELAGVSAC